MLWKPNFHIAPPQGWLNDPNGLCQLQGVHHIFFQYSPANPRGELKYWGHYETEDFINYRYTGIVLSPDAKTDKDGVYSGSALVEDDTIYLYYTGNEKEEGDFDYILQGRGSNTTLVTTKDGQTVSPKEVLLTSADYTDRLSCHVRDPKVWKEDGCYHMVLGGRTKEHQGCILKFVSDNMRDWHFERYLEMEEAEKNPFGFMWECPDLFELDGHKILSFSPQGLMHSATRFQNIFQSGYLPDLKMQPEAFVEWDMGFDFYAPQSYLDEKGRRILIGWMGVPGASYDHDPSIDAGWQHMLTIPRQLHFDEEKDRVRQWPLAEFEQLRGEEIPLQEKKAQVPEMSCFELLVDGIKQDFELRLGRGFYLTYQASQNLLTMGFCADGFGRDLRNLALQNGEKLQSLRILVDVSCVEIFVNQGDYVLTTKYFSRERNVEMIGNYQNATMYALQSCNWKMVGKP